jgi:alcohol dehydrogenase (cytochrome c)/quinohemoprotein ethanol dehydrogenase
MNRPIIEKKFISLSMSVDSRFALIVALIFALTACGKTATSKPQSQDAATTGPAAVDSARMLGAARDGADWLSYGRTYSEQRFSPLRKINARNAKGLGLAWSYDLDTHRGQESTPLVIDGVMYVTSAWSKVLALDAGTGKLIWEYDPKVPGAWAINACCDVVNRGVAAWKGKIYVGTLDGRLIALDAGTGAPVWSVQTFDRSRNYTITGAPRVIKGLVLIGNGGSEYNARGFVTAYDADTGKQVWRFYTVPGNPAQGFENSAMKMAAATWHGEWWKLGGGGSPWNAIVYDPVTDLIYIGTGNGVPWNSAFRSPGGGDNLFTDSIVALRPETGEYVWHYQEVPGDDWDFDSTQDIMIADLMIGGAKHHVLMHAPKNGFFYVLDARTGKLISVGPYAPMNWATGIDMKTGRPIETANARYPKTGKQFVGEPSPQGAHNWQPWSFNPMTGLVYIPEQEIGFPYESDENFKAVNKKGANLGLDMKALEQSLDPREVKQVTAGWKGNLIAWDPVKQEARWKVPHAGPWNGGTLTTAGNLVVQGLATGKVDIYSADKGDDLWSFPAQTGVMAGPMTYAVKGEQYIAVVAGWGGSYALTTGEQAKSNHAATRNISRILVFKLGGTATLPPLPPAPEMKLEPPSMPQDLASIKRGEALYNDRCNVCHGSAAASGGLVPDLRYSPQLKLDSWYDIVLRGALEGNGMVNFGDVLSHDEATDIRNYIIKQANETLAIRKAEAGNTK